jgi:deoxyribodipyrimidine photolyase
MTPGSRETMGLGLGQSYPDRIVDHALARERALAAYGRMNDEITV